MTLQEQIDALNQEITSLKAAIPAPVAPPPKPKPVYHQTQYRFFCADVRNGSRDYSELSKFYPPKALHTMKDAKAEASARSLKVGGVPVVFADWQTPWEDAVKKRCASEVDKQGRPNPTCVCIIEEVSVIEGNNSSYSLIREWLSDQPLPNFILSEQGE